MVSQGVIIGGAAAGGTFVLLCATVLVYCCCCRGRSKTKLKRKIKRADRPTQRIDSSKTKPPKLDLQERVINEAENVSEGQTTESTVYPPLRASISLPAVTSSGSKPKTPKTPQHRLSRDFHNTGFEYNPLDVKNGGLGAIERTLNVVMENIGGEKVDDAEIGQIQFRIEYLYTSCALRVTLHQAVDLPIMDVNGLCDPYVEVTLVDTAQITPTGKVLKTEASFQTKPMKCTLNPTFQVTNDLSCPPDVPLQRLAILMHIWDYDKVSRNELIGHMCVALKDIDVTSMPTMWKAFKPGKNLDMAEMNIPLGELNVALNYKAEIRTLRVLILNARHLPKINQTKMPDAFVKIRLIHNGVKIASKDISPEKNSAIFNKTVRFVLPKEDTTVEECTLSISVWHHEIVNSTPIGVINLGNSLLSTESERAHWSDMVQAQATDRMLQDKHELRAFTSAMPYEKRGKRKKAKATSDG